MGDQRSQLSSQSSWHPISEKVAMPGGKALGEFIGRRESGSLQRGIPASRSKSRPYRDGAEVGSRKRRCRPPRGGGASPFHSLHLCVDTGLRSGKRQAFSPDHVFGRIPPRRQDPCRSWLRSRSQLLPLPPCVSEASDVGSGQLSRRRR